MLQPSSATFNKPRERCRRGRGVATDIENHCTKVKQRRRGGKGKEKGLLSIVARKQTSSFASNEGGGSRKCLKRLIRIVRYARSSVRAKRRSGSLPGITWPGRRQSVSREGANLLSRRSGGEETGAMEFGIGSCGG